MNILRIWMDTTTDSIEAEAVLESLGGFSAVCLAAAKRSQFAERAVMLAWFTGHRAGAIRQLQWSDIDLDAASIRWRAETDKVGYEHRNPLHPELVTFLKRERAGARRNAVDARSALAGRRLFHAESGNG